MSDPLNPSNEPPIPPSPSTPPPTPTPAPTMDYATPAPGGGIFASPNSGLMPVTDPNARTWGLLAHLSGFAGCLIPFGNIIGPLVVWQIKKDEIPFAGDQAKEALNFHITLWIILAVCIALACVVIGFFLLPLVGIYGMVFTIVGAVKANQGEWYRYPLTIRLVK